MPAGSSSWPMTPSNAGAARRDWWAWPGSSGRGRPPWPTAWGAGSRLRGRAGGVSDAREWLYSSFARNFHPVTEIPREEHLVADTTRPLEELLLEIEARLR